MSYDILHGDCLTLLRILPAASIDSIVTDPPAGIGFLNQPWDSDRGGRAAWVAWMTLVAAECLRVLKPGGHALVWALPRTSHWTATAWEDAGWEIRDRIGHVFGGGMPKSKNLPGGLGTGLKPAVEDWWLCRKPLGGTVAQTVARYGTGALNIDASRVSGGRWPAHLLHDGSEAALTIFPVEGRSTKASSGGGRGLAKTSSILNKPQAYRSEARYLDAGSAARFFWCSKASKADKGVGNTHPTAKSERLMRYLVRLITPTNGTVLDPFCGSGSTGKAALLEGHQFLGIEQDAGYVEIARRRLAAVAPVLL